MLVRQISRTSAILGFASVLVWSSVSGSAQKASPDLTIGASLISKDNMWWANVGSFLEQAAALRGVKLVVLWAQGDPSNCHRSKGSLLLTTDRADTTTIVGYGRVLVSNNVPISGLALFGEFESKAEKDKFEVEIESQAAVEPTGRMRSFAVTDFRKNELKGTMGGANFEFESETATGLAVINVGIKDTILTLTKFNAGGVRMSVLLWG